MKKIVFSIIGVCILIGFWFLYSEIFTAEAQKSDKVIFDVRQGESVTTLAERLDEERIIRSPWLFRKYVGFKGLDRDIRFGTFEVSSPITLSRVVAALQKPGVYEREITIIPGWDLRDIAEYFEKEGIATPAEFFDVVGDPAHEYSLTRQLPAGLLRIVPYPASEPPFRVLGSKAWFVGLEGYLRPDTYRIFQDATLDDIIVKLLAARDTEMTDQMYADAKTVLTRLYPEKASTAPTVSFHDVLTVASLLEREVRGPKDKALVADIIWSRYVHGVPLQLDSTVHYAVNKKGDVFTTPSDRDSQNPWNTYKYPGLPPGPIAMPTLESILAAIYPEKNEYQYFLTTLDTGEVKYAKTLDEHNQNVWKYLR